MKIKHDEDSDATNHDETISIEFMIPSQPDFDAGVLADFYIIVFEDEPGFAADPLSLFLEQCEDYESSRAVISWLEFYIAEIKERYPLLPNAVLSGKPTHDEL
jgi:hypothetical protein